MEFYIKDGRRYKRIYETPRLYSDGIWLVETKKHGNSKQMILKLGELDELYPFAQMMGSHDKLSRWLSLKGVAQFMDSLVVNYDGKGITYSFGSPSETGREILKFLSLNEDQQNEEIKKLEQETEIDWEGNVRDKNGALIYESYKAEAIQANIEKKRKEIAKLEKRLEQAKR